MAAPDLQPAEADLRRLVNACRDTLFRSANEMVRVVAGVLDDHGHIFTAVQVRSRNCNHCSVCAEPVAVGAALTAGSATLVACAAIVRCGDTARVWSPCGSCRELLRDHAVGYVVVDDEHDVLVAVPTVDLLPWP